MPPKRVLKFLALHGHAMNPQVFEKKIGAVRSEVKKLGVEFVFAQGPIIPDHDWMNPNANEEDENEKTKSAGSPSKMNTNAPLVPDPITAVSSKDHSASEGNGVEERLSEANTVYSWADFWSWRRNKLPKPHYYGFADTMKTFEAISKAHGPFDGIFAFSQGTGAAALWLALEAQELRRSVEIAEKKNNNENEGEGEKVDAEVKVEDDDILVASDNIPLTEWKIPKDLQLLRYPSTTKPADSNNDSQPLPFLLVNVSGVIQKDDVFGHFVTSQLSSLPDTEMRLASIIATSNSLTSRNSANVNPLRPLHVLNVYGQNDAVVSPELTRTMTNLYNSVCNATDTKTDPTSGSTSATMPPAPKLAFGGSSTEWTHDGGHVVPALLRKPLKAIVEQLFGNGKQ